MPVSYSIDRNSGTIRTRCVGDITFDEVVEHFQVLRQDPNRPDRLDVLLDLTKTTSVPTSEQVRMVSRVVGQAQETIHFEACAIAASTDVLFGMSRVFQVLTEVDFRATCVFRSVEEAEAWLRSQQSTANGAKG